MKKGTTRVYQVISLEMVDQTGVSWNRAVLWLREISGLLERGSDSACPKRLTSMRTGP